MSVRTLIRRTVRRSLKPLVMFGIVGTLSLSLIVTTPSNAQAFVPVPILPVVAGATTMAMPSLLTASLALHPVGWGIAAVAAIGIGLYATKDYWLPYVTGELGIGDDPNNTSPSPNSSGWVDPNVSIRSVGLHSTNLNTAVIVVDTIAPTHTSAVNFFVSTYLECNSKPDATGTKFGPYRWTPNSSYSNTYGRTVTLQPACDSGYLVGFIAGPTYGVPELTQAAGSGQGPTNVMRWGTLSQTADPSFDPRSDALSYRVDAECIAPDGTISTASASSLGSESGIKFPSCEAQGKGHGTGAVKVFTAAPGFAPDEVLWEIKRPAEDPAQPLCSPTRPTSGCKLGVKLDGQPCVMGSVECENWSSLRNDPNYSTRLSCQYGPYTVSLDTCNPLERAYEPGGAPATDPNVDGNPATRSDTMPDGQVQPKPDVGVAPGGFPTTGTNNEEDPCLKDAWSWTPADWVKNPVVCALKDAFVPKTDIQARSNQLRQKSLDTVPISWLSAPLVGPGGGGCPNWTINVAGLSKNVICDSSFTAALTAVRVPLFGLVAAAMVWPLIRGIWYAAIPVLRVTPGSSK